MFALYIYRYTPAEVAEMEKKRMAAEKKKRDDFLVRKAKADERRRAKANRAAEKADEKAEKLAAKAAKREARLIKSWKMKLLKKEAEDQAAKVFDTGDVVDVQGYLCTGTIRFIGEHMPQVCVTPSFGTLSAAWPAVLVKVRELVIPRVV